MNITISLTKSYMQYAVIMLMSLVDNNPEEEFHIYIIHNDMEEADFVEMDNIINSDSIFLIPIRVEKGICNIFEINGWNEAAAFRLLVIDLFADGLDRILHLDIDTLVVGSIRELYDTEFENQYLVVCEDPSENLLIKRDMLMKRNFDEDYSYFNSGVILFNLEKLRDDGFDFNFFSSIPKQYPNLVFEYPDQDLLNYVFGEKVKILDNMRYNYVIAYYQDSYPDKYYDTKEKLIENTSIVHMATADKPWKGIHDNVAVRWWWSYAKKTPYYEELLRDYITSIQSHIDFIHDKCKERICGMTVNSVCELEEKKDKLVSVLDLEIEMYKSLLDEDTTDNS